MELQELIIKICEELETSSLNEQRKRYLQAYLEEHFSYKRNHPTATEVPNSLQLFCDLNPEAPECRKYEL